MKKSIYILIAFVLVLGLSLAWQQSSVQAQDSDPDDLVALGKAIFFDTGLSVNGKQSCASCHAPECRFLRSGFNGKPRNCCLPGSH